MLARLQAIAYSLTPSKPTWYGLAAIIAVVLTSTGVLAHVDARLTGVSVFAVALVWHVVYA